jgi:hypothetical protein
MSDKIIKYSSEERKLVSGKSLSVDREPEILS